MRNQRGRLLLLSLFALLTTLLALLGIGKGSAGAVARNIECSHKLAHHLELAQSLERQHAAPPRQQQPIAEYLIATYSPPH